MNRFIGAIHKLNNLRESKDPLSLSRDSIAIYEPLNNQNHWKNTVVEMPGEVVPTRSLLNWVFALTVILSVFLLLYSYSLSLDTRRQTLKVISMQTLLAKQQESLHKDIMALNDKFRDSSIAWSFKFNTIEHEWLNNFQDELNLLTKRLNVLSQDVNSLTVEFNNEKIVPSPIQGKELIPHG